MLAVISVIIGGILTVAMGIFHCFFYRLFGWEEAFEKVGMPNKRIFYTIHIALLLLFFGIGIISILYSWDLAKGGGLENSLLVFLALFWLWRFLWQIFYFKASRRRVPKRMKVRAAVLTIVFFLLFIAYTLPLII